MRRAEGPTAAVGQPRRLEQIGRGQLVWAPASTESATTATAVADGARRYPERPLPLPRGSTGGCHRASPRTWAMCARTPSRSRAERGPASRGGGGARRTRCVGRVEGAWVVGGVGSVVGRGVARVGSMPVRQRDQLRSSMQQCGRRRPARGSTYAPRAGRSREPCRAACAWHGSAGLSILLDGQERARDRQLVLTLSGHEKER